MSTITPSGLDERRTSGEDPFVLDIRPVDDFARGHIDDSHNVPVYGDLQRGTDASLRAHLDELPADRSVIVVCKAGIVARRATAVLSEEGYDASTLLGGMSGWNGYRNDTLGYKLRSLLWSLSG
ncbi:rhodanese-like domain-containing protein [Halorubrum sp. JWXQ-INN 858]|uniref:rhodanese-like domain-containing protein n=1 Tax=Halorubrum sp. JWXQ-INN 858 TaxID=2690782 RepID=UPI0013591A7C|nr:rhodanese-like domain-containing protein [Halorubrum sp. JWXQ-INN 858]MWV65414.1 rhodanese-like domain-containing protein [Halorubrum sp. JWXQ-INN 858]